MYVVKTTTHCSIRHQVTRRVSFVILTLQIFCRFFGFSDQPIPIQIFRTSTTDRRASGTSTRNTSSYTHFPYVTDGMRNANIMHLARLCTRKTWGWPRKGLHSSIKKNPGATGVGGVNPLACDEPGSHPCTHTHTHTTRGIIIIIIITQPVRRRVFFHPRTHTDTHTTHTTQSWIMNSKKKKNEKKNPWSETERWNTHVHYAFFMHFVSFPTPVF